MDWTEENSESRRQRIKSYSEDCSALLWDLHLMFPELEEKIPSEKVEDVLVEVCRFHVVDRPLPKSQLALCDFSNEIVMVNSEMDKLPVSVNYELLRRSTLAHELGHVRLHADEMREGFTTTFYSTFNSVADSRAFQREREADLYAGLFLVPIEQLLQDRGIQRLLKLRTARKSMGNHTIRNLIKRLARKYQVSQAFLRRYLFELRWLRKGEQTAWNSWKLQVRFPSED